MEVVKGKRAWYVISGDNKKKFRTESEAVAFALGANKEVEIPMENTDAVREGNLWVESGSSEEEEAGEEAWQEVDDEV